ncbi:PHB depolymerase family esterase [Fibrobacter sp.]|uniref:PHB depolymerase family esterase n=1 Tax=Fibrobacter sp. TaxID=35828 RepID=UPI00388F7245
MHLSKLPVIAGGIALATSMSFGWSISGQVTTKAGEPLSGVKINTMNMGGFETTSNETGAFALSSDGSTEAISGISVSTLSVHFAKNVLGLENVNAHNLKISVVDALGKVTFQKEVREAFGSMSFDLGKTAFGAKFARVNADGKSQTYSLTDGKALLKEGDILPFIQFAKEGFANTTYQMQQEVEENVKITLEAASATPATPASSASVVPATPASSETAVVPASSEAKAEVVVDCSGKEYKAGDHNMSVNVDGKNRTFIMHVPSAYKGDKPVPLVVDYHPIGGNGQGQLQGTQYKSQTDPEGVISLYPDGTGKPGGMGNGWNVGPCCSNDDDVKFSREMIKAVEEKVCIDTKRVYATGFSMGGGMSNHVACNMADIYAAVAPAGMDLNTTNSASCNPARPISIIMFRGTGDFVCRYQGGDSGFNDGLNFLGAEGNFKFWAEKNGCTGSPSMNANGCNEYSNCKDGVKVVLCTDKSTNNHNGSSHDQGDGTVGWPFLKSFTLP